MTTVTRAVGPARWPQQGPAVQLTKLGLGARTPTQTGARRFKTDAGGAGDRGNDNTQPKYDLLLDNLDDVVSCVVAIREDTPNPIIH